MKRMLAGLGVTMLVAFATPAFAEDDATFLKTAIGINLAEISAGDLAQKNGGSDAVKQFGMMMVADHSKGRDEAVALAQKMSVEVPGAPSEEAQAAAQKLATMTGAEFDKAFAAEMVKGHETAIALFTDKADDGDNEVSTWAKNTLPTLQKHLDEAKRLASGTM